MPRPWSTRACTSQIRMGAVYVLAPTIADQVVAVIGGVTALFAAVGRPPRSLDISSAFGVLDDQPIPSHGSGFMRMAHMAPHLSPPHPWRLKRALPFRRQRPHNLGGTHHGEHDAIHVP